MGLDHYAWPERFDKKRKKKKNYNLQNKWVNIFCFLIYIYEYIKKYISELP